MYDEPYVKIYYREPSSQDMLKWIKPKYVGYSNIANFIQVVNDTDVVTTIPLDLIAKVESKGVEIIYD